MDNSKRHAMESVTWPDIKATLFQANPEVAERISAINPQPHEHFVIARYPFGADLLKQNQFYLPIDNQILKPINDPSIPNNIQTELNYAKMPVGILINQSVEVFYETSKRILSDRILKAGDVIGLWELLDQRIQKDSTQLRSLSSGARSIFMVPKISDRAFHKRLTRKLDITTDVPTNLREHRNLFASISHRLSDSNPWFCEMIFLGRSLYQRFNQLTMEKAGQHFYDIAWDQSYNFRRQFENNLEWESTLYELNKKNIYIKPHVLSHIKQIYSISEGIFPGMTFAKTSDNHIAPIDKITHAYANIYGIKEYAPLIMYPAHIDTCEPVYYSMNFPSYVEAFLEPKSTPRLMDDLCAAKNIIENSSSTFSPNTQFRFYHAAAQTGENILPASDIALHNTHLENYFRQHSYYKFPSKSPFFNGCMEIRKERSKIAHNAEKM